MAVDIAPFRYRPGRALASYPTRCPSLGDPEALLADAVARLSDLQELLWADDRYAVLLVFQGMDTAGKDGTIKRVTTGVNPAGFQVVSFRAPSRDELDHNYLWRYWRAMPERGRIGIFNRSYYEEVVVVRVHPEMIDARPLPHEHVDETFWAHRLEDIVAMERHLCRNGTRIVKFLLHLSPEEQKDRLLKRLTKRDKLWKFDPADVEEREHWAAYQHAYDRALRHTHADHAPWYVVPADDKPTMRAIVAEVVTEEIGRLDLTIPRPAPGEDDWIDAAITRLKGGEAQRG